MIYFVQAIDGGPIKIGYTGNVRKRLSGLRSSNPTYLILLGVMDGDREMEKHLHGKFKKIQGEWFEPARKLFDFINQNCDETLRPYPAMDVNDFEFETA